MTIWIISAIICALIGYNMGDKRSVGAGAGMLIGLLLGIIGILILLFFPVVDDKSDYISDNAKQNSVVHYEDTNPVNNSIKADELQKWHLLYKEGAITEEEYVSKKNQILSN